ncbi:MAG: type II secretion system protein GspG [Planctomycetes bacterium]|nr:type II secretion system protein GspG [Planctomycetota bacterium]
MRVNSPRRGFTLIELLVVIAIIGVLATLLLSAIFGAKSKAKIGVAKSEIRSIEAALSMYRGDQGRFPRLALRPTDGQLGSANHDAWRDDSPALYAALRNRPTVALGGGQGSPYLDWKAENVGYLDANFVRPDNMGQNHAGGLPNPTGVTPLEPANYDRLTVAAFQQQFAPNPNLTGARFLVLLDPWGNPYHYREWASVRQSVKDQFMAGTGSHNRTTAFDVARRQGQVPVNPARDAIHNPDAFDIWSNGPNGINEFGAPESDDVTSWSQ